MIFKSGLYETNSTKNELRKTSIISWIKGPLLEVIAFFLIFIDYRLALGLISIVTLTYIVPPKRM